MSRILATVAVFAVLAAPAAARSHGGAPTPWAPAEITVVVAHGLLAVTTLALVLFTALGVVRR